MNIVIEGLKHLWSKSMLDLFANYFVQRVLDIASDEQRLIILQEVAPVLPFISCDRQGTRSIQKLVILGSKTKAEQAIIMNVFLRLENHFGESNTKEGSNPHLFEVMTHVNGSHVIQIILQYFNAECVAPLVQRILQSSQYLVTDARGIPVLKFCLQLVSTKDLLTTSMEILKRVAELSFHKYGNYAIQHIIELTAKNATLEKFRGESFQSKQLLFMMIHKGLIGKYLPLSLTKFSAPVVEKLLRLGPPEIKTGILAELTEDEAITRLLSNPYGNHILKFVFQVANPQESAKLYDRIRPLLSTMRSKQPKQYKDFMLPRNRTQQSSSSSSRSPFSFRGHPSSAQQSHSSSPSPPPRRQNFRPKFGPPFGHRRRRD